MKLRDDMCVRSKLQNSQRLESFLLCCPFNPKYSQEGTLFSAFSLKFVAVAYKCRQKGLTAIDRAVYLTSRNLLVRDGNR